MSDPAPATYSDEAVLAREASRVLAAQMAKSEPLVLGLPRRGTVKLPASAVRKLIHILDQMALGNATALIPVRTELTTQEAAELLNISRPSLIHLLDDGKIEFRRIGTHRRVLLESVTAYKRRSDAARLAALTELAAYDQELGI